RDWGNAGDFGKHFKITIEQSKKATTAKVGRNRTFIQRAMKNEKHPLDGFFKEGLNEHKIQPSASVWNKIEEAQPEPNHKKGAWLLLRAAVVALLIGLGVVFYFANREVEVNQNVVTGPDNFEVEGPEKNNSEQKQNKATEENKDKTDTPKEEAKPKKKAVPIMRQSTSRPIYVSNDAPLQPIDEE